ncbi:glycosyltransferase family A protein [Haladaptatus sp. F3-133]|uniref:Glycosyltransferase family A protein n=1 Tax=Halorutilus salinus TaxID=2487751 RepID=A0A9Q4C2D9_9EURY|nr:glycosyltransferase family A protein [Halorutilus salinus]MCX2818622.1 glycosyltransferase family A protein [Halorutilus salinus]
MSSPKASIIIRCYNEREHIGKLLHGVFEQTFQDFEVLLVDSGSTDGTLEVARQYPIDDVVYISPDKFSFGRSLNYGCEEADGEYCVFASAHVYPRRKDWLEKILEKFEDEDVALVYGKQRGDETTKFSERRIFQRWFPEEDIDYQITPFCNNANAAIRRELWEEFPYDESLTGLEDLDWAKRVKNAGYEISYASEAEIVHVHDETPSEILNRYRREAIAHKQIIPEQSFGFRDFIGAFLRNMFSDYTAAARQGSLWGNIRSIPTFRLMQFWGTYQGFRRHDPVTEELRERFYYPDKNGYPEDRNKTVKAKGGDTSETEEIDYTEAGAVPEPEVD